MPSRVGAVPSLHCHSSPARDCFRLVKRFFILRYIASTEVDFIGCWVRESPLPTSLDDGVLEDIATLTGDFHVLAVIATGGLQLQEKSAKAGKNRKSGFCFAEITPIFGYELGLWCRKFSAEWYLWRPNSASPFDLRGDFDGRRINSAKTAVRTRVRNRN